VALLFRGVDDLFGVRIAQGRNIDQRSSAYSSTATQATAASVVLYSSIMTRVPSTRMPSMIPSTNCVVRLVWICWIDPKRDTISPVWRFSK